MYGTIRLDRFSFSLNESKIPEVSVNFDTARFMKENLLESDNWLNTDLEPLEFQGILGKGYIRYKTEFEPGDVKYMIIRYYEGSSKGDWSRQTVGDPTIVLINDKYVPEASGWHPRKVKFDVSSYLKQGRNKIEVVLEKIGRPCGGRRVGYE